MGSTTDIRNYLKDDTARVRFGLFTKTVTAGGKTVEVGQNATNEEVAEMLDREKLKHEFPGGLQTRIIGSEQYVTLGTKTVTVSPMATDQEIATALNLDKIDGVAASAPVKAIPASGGFTPGALKALLQSIRDRQQSVMGGAVEKAKALNAALDQVEKVSGAMDATANGILSEIGQFSNMPDE